MDTMSGACRAGPSVLLAAQEEGADAHQDPELPETPQPLLREGQL